MSNIIDLPNNACIRYSASGGGWVGHLSIAGKDVCTSGGDTIIELVGRLIIEKRLEEQPIRWTLPANSRIEIIVDRAEYIGILYVDDKEVCRTAQSCTSDATMALIRDWNMTVRKKYQVPLGDILVVQRGKNWIAGYKELNATGMTEAEAIGNLILLYSKGQK